MIVETERRDDTLIAKISGRIQGAAGAEEFREGLEQTEHSNHQALVLDCRDLAYISSAGLRIIVIKGKQNTVKGIPMAACNMIAPIREVFEVSGFDQIIAVRETLEEALAAVQTRE